MHKQIEQSNDKCDPHCASPEPAPEYPHLPSYPAPDYCESMSPGSLLPEIKSTPSSESQQRQWLEQVMPPEGIKALAVASKDHRTRHFAYCGDGKMALLTLVGEGHLQTPKALRAGKALLAFYPSCGCEGALSKSAIGRLEQILWKPLDLFFSNPITGSLISAAYRDRHKNPEARRIVWLEEGHAPTRREDAAIVFYCLLPSAIYMGGLGRLASEVGLSAFGNSLNSGGLFFLLAFFISYAVSALALPLWKANP